MKNPISPHLQIYRLDINALMSISHRISGILLFVGTVGFLKFLIMLALFPELQPIYSWLLQRWLVQGFLLTYAAALFYHSFNGIRHMLWDLGLCFEKEQIKFTGWIVLGSTLLSTFLLWRAVYA